MIDELHGFIDRPSRDSTAREQQMRSLPHPPGLKTLFLIITIAHSDNAENRRSTQLIRVGIPVATGRQLSQQSLWRELDKCRRRRRQAERVNGEAVAILLDVAPVPSNPPLASVLHIRIGVYLLIGFGNDLDD